MVVAGQASLVEPDARLQRIFDPRAHIVKVDDSNPTGRHVDMAPNKGQRALANRSTAEQEKASVEGCRIDY
jgi:hypothetical protein